MFFVAAGNHRVIASQVGRRPRDHLIQTFLGKALSRQMTQPLLQMNYVSPGAKLTLVFVEFCNVSSLFQPIHLPAGWFFFQCVYFHTQFGIDISLGQGALDPIMQITCENIKQT